MKKIILITMAIFLLSFPLYGCGKKSAPNAPDNNNHPNIYPAPE